MKRLALVFYVLAVAYAGPPNHNQPPPRIPPHHQYQNFNPRSLQQPFYKDTHIIASPKPRNHPYPQPANYRTLNPGGSHPRPTYLPAPQQHLPPSHAGFRQGRSEPNHHYPNQHAQLIASASNTPVLVLKKDHQRPLLSSAVVAAAISQPREQAKQLPTDIPTVIIESPKKHHHHYDNNEPLITSPSNHQTTTAPKKNPTTQQKQNYQDSSNESMPQSPENHHGDEQPANNEQASSGLTAPSPVPSPASHASSTEQDASIPPTASAERRMFFESVAQNSGLAQQVSGPQGPSSPQNKRQNKQKPLLASASSNQQHQQRPRHQQHHDRLRHNNHEQDDDIMEGDEQIERIARSNSESQYGGGNLAFQYPPPQGNYIAQGPTRVPVKYQQGVIGFKPQHIQQKPHHPHHPHHPSQQQQHHLQQSPYKQRIQQAQHQAGLHRGPPHGDLTSEEQEELDEEAADAKPDRLTELLQTSKFSCAEKKDGYYADDTLNCEVFHYCQDGGKHSWLCPNGFAFHQIHLICVPPSSDNICKQSSNYHFVNEYLYKPINQKEADNFNASLKYADRYFPDGYNNGAGDMLLPYHEDGEDGDERRGQQQQQQHRHHHPQQQHHSRPPHNPYAHIPVVPRPTQPRPQQQQQQQAPFNPYANIHPRPTGGFIPIPSSPTPHHHPRQQQQQLRPQQAYAQQRSSQSLIPQQQHPVAMKQPKQHNNHPHHHHPHSHHHHHPHGNSHPNVFFTPESINIPLNQRRPIPNPHAPHHPQIFRPSPQVSSKSISSKIPSPPTPTGAGAPSSNKRKYEEEDYEY